MAYQQASMISKSGQLDPFTPPAIWVMMDMVEAATRTGRVEQARAHVAAIKEAGIDKLSGRLALLAGGSAALVAPAGAAEEIFERAMSISGLERWPFDVARVHLLYGEYLRRNRSTTRARHYLNLAVETFDFLGAQPWLKRAGQELRAAGLSQLHADEHPSAVLTSQELEIAKLAGSGLTNREIGQRLYLSHRTVGTHLYRVFPKLGITTRAALRDALSDAIVESCA